jgi:hypothetical protein
MNPGEMQQSDSEAHDAMVWDSSWLYGFLLDDVPSSGGEAPLGS